MRLLCFLLLAWAPAHETLDDWKVDFKVSLAEKDGAWSFVVEGSTNLPADVVLTAQVCVDGDEPLVEKSDPLQPSSRSFTPAKGKFREVVHTFRRKPYSISYRAWIRYEIGTDSVARHVDLRVGTDAEYESELKARVREMGEDLRALEKMGAELAGWIDRAANAPAGWMGWKKASAAAIDAMQERNRHRFKIWAVWPEYQGRMRIGGLSEFLEKEIAELDGPDADAERLRRAMAAFTDSIDEAYTVLGIEPPIDPKKARSALVSYERAVSALLEGKEGSPRTARAAGVSALFDLLFMLRNRPRGYAYLSEVGLRLNRVFELVEDRASNVDLLEAARQHDAALREFRAYASLP